MNKVFAIALLVAIAAAKPNGKENDKQPKGNKREDDQDFLNWASGKNKSYKDLG